MHWQASTTSWLLLLEHRTCACKESQNTSADHRKHWHTSAASSHQHGSSVTSVAQAHGQRQVIVSTVSGSAAWCPSSIVVTAVVLFACFWVFPGSTLKVLQHLNYAGPTLQNSARIVALRCRRAAVRACFASIRKKLKLVPTWH